MAQDQKDFFISYTSADRQWAEWIAWHLEDAGYTTVIQAWDFRAGGNFILEMHRAAMETGRTIAVLSEKYQQSLYTQIEWAAALVHDPTGQKRLVIPVRIDSVTPAGLLAPLIYIDLAGLPEEQAKDKLFADIQATMSSEPQRPATAPHFPGGVGTTPSAATAEPRFPGVLPGVWSVPFQRNRNFTGESNISATIQNKIGEDNLSTSKKRITHKLESVSSMNRDEDISNSTLEVFISYSRRDENLRNELAKHLSLLKRRHIIQMWYDREIDASDEWKRELDKHLNSAQIILLLVSADFLYSDYCYEIEMKRALERHNNGEARVIPVILRPVDWSEAPFSNLQALPKDAKPVSSWDNIDDAFKDISIGIRKVAKEMSVSFQISEKQSQQRKRQDVPAEFEKVRNQLIQVKQLRDEKLIDDMVAQEWQRELMKKII